MEQALEAEAEMAVEEVGVKQALEAEAEMAMEEAGVEQALDAEAEQAVEEAGVEEAGAEEVGVEEAGAEAVEVNNIRFATTQTSFLGLVSATVVSFVLQNRKSVHPIKSSSLCFPFRSIITMLLFFSNHFSEYCIGIRPHLRFSLRNELLVRTR